MTTCRLLLRTGLRYQAPALHIGPGVSEFRSRRGEHVRRQRRRILVLYGSLRPTSFSRDLALPLRHKAAPLCDLPETRKKGPKPLTVYIPHKHALAAQIRAVESSLLPEVLIRSRGRQDGPRVRSPPGGSAPLVPKKNRGKGSSGRSL